MKGKTMTYKTDEEVMEALLLCRGVISDTARMLGLASSSSLRVRIKKDEVLNATCEEARSEMKDLAENKLFQAIDNGEKWAILFYLKSIGRDRGYNEIKDINMMGNHTIEFVWDDDNEVIYEDKDEFEETSSQDTVEGLPQVKEI